MRVAPENQMQTRRGDRNTLARARPAGIDRPRRGRHLTSAEGPRNRVLTFKVNAAEEERLEAAARGAGIEVADAFRGWINRTADVALVDLVRFEGRDLRLYAIRVLLLALATLAPVDAFAQASGPVQGRQPITMQLEYVRASHAESCPDDTLFRGAVAARARHELFQPASPLRLVVKLSPARRGYEGQAELHDARGGVKVLAAFPATASCTRLVDDLAIAVSLYAAPPAPPGDPRQASLASATAEPSCAAPQADRHGVWPAEWPVLKQKPDPSPERSPIAIRLGLAMWPEVIASGAGGASLGLSADVGMRWEALSAGVEVHGDPPLGSASYQGVGTVTFARISGALLVCAHGGWFAGCGVADAGRIIFPAHPQTLPSSTWYGAVGVRAGVDFPVKPGRVFVRTLLDLRAPIRPANYSFRGQDVFVASGLGFGLGLGVVVELPP